MRRGGLDIILATLRAELYVSILWPFKIIWLDRFFTCTFSLVLVGIKTFSAFGKKYDTVRVHVDVSFKVNMHAWVRYLLHVGNREEMRAAFSLALEKSGETMP